MRSVRGALVCLAFVATQGVAQDSGNARYAAEARSGALGMQQTLAGRLFAEINANGAESAIGVCKTMAPNAAAELSAKQGAKISRVSLRPRNPVLGHADAWEQQVLIDFDQRAAKGEKPETLEHFETVDEPAGRYFRYMKALPVQPLCLNCHGSPEAIPQGIRARLAAEYPGDRATGYRAGEIRGAITIKRAIP